MLCLDARVGLRAGRTASLRPFETDALAAAALLTHAAVAEVQWVGLGAESIIETESEQKVNTHRFEEIEIGEQTMFYVPHRFSQSRQLH